MTLACETEASPTTAYSGLTQWQTLVIQALFRAGTESTVICIVLKIILMEISSSSYTDPLGIIVQIIFLLAYFGTRLGQAAHTYWSVHRFSNSWERAHIKKMRKAKKDVLRWKDISLSDARVGDIVRLKYCDIAPVDLLILDTSEQRYSDNILKTNERKVRGENHIRIKRSIRNLDMRSQTAVMSKTDYLSRLSKKLNGYIEYDPPGNGSREFSGIFKLKNDPKITNITEENVLFCGTKLYSKE